MLQEPMSRPSPSELLRLALTPRWLAATGLVLLVALACVLLGRWQWDRTQAILAAERAAISAPIPIDAALGNADELPAESIGRPVTAAGEFDPDLQVAVTSREHDGQPGVWIVTGLRLDDGRVVAVLRGWQQSVDSAGATALAGPVSISGVLQPDESFYADALNAPGTVAAIDHARLAQLWGEDVTTGFVVMASQVPSSEPSPIPVLPTIQTADVPFPLQNFVYAFQWWLFALFGIAVLGRWLWLEARRSAQERAPISNS